MLLKATVQEARPEFADYPCPQVRSHIQDVCHTFPGTAAACALKVLTEFN
jgi:hypothetical protein